MVLRRELTENLREHVWNSLENSNLFPRIDCFWSAILMGPQSAQNWRKKNVLIVYAREKHSLWDLFLQKVFFSCEAEILQISNLWSTFFYVRKELILETKRNPQAKKHILPPSSKSRFWTNNFWWNSWIFNSNENLFEQRCRSVANLNLDSICATGPFVLAKHTIRNFKQINSNRTTKTNMKSRRIKFNT